MAPALESEEFVLKLSTKESVRAAVAGGWWEVNAACLP